MIKDQVYRCGVCGEDSVSWSELKRHYAKQHPRAKRADSKLHHVVAKPFIKVPRCQTCRYSGSDCVTLPRYESWVMRSGSTFLDQICTKYRI